MFSAQFVVSTKQARDPRLGALYPNLFTAPVAAAVTSSSATFITAAFIMSLEGTNVVYYARVNKNDNDERIMF